ncbi:hypothetical protein T484DRAFT_2180735 [Baffinella frigidus]|nr:hypothetical protein T484DRAFT_2180735 [Cryptophyta sp. CCMP2293]
MLRESRFLRKHIILDKSQHSYRSGAQHTSIQQYHDAGFRTSLFIVQNDAGAGKWPVTAQVPLNPETGYLDPQNRGACICPCTAGCITGVSRIPDDAGAGKWPA